MNAPAKSPAEHTPGPWKLAGIPDNMIVCDADGGSLADCAEPGPWMSKQIAEANAAFIVKAVNNHAPMVKSLEHCATLFDTLAQTMDRWAAQSREFGWSTHQVDENRKRADDCRRYAAQIRETLTTARTPADRTGV